MFNSLNDLTVHNAIPPEMFMAGGMPVLSQQAWFDELCNVESDAGRETVRAPLLLL